MIELAWTTLFVDVPASVFDRSLAFWAGVTGFEPSPPSGDQGQYRSLTPPAADAHLRLQRVGGETGGVHLDLHVPSVDAAAETATGLGAAVVDDITDDQGRFIVCRSPAGAVFCLVGAEDEQRIAPPGGPGPNAISTDQISIDVPAEHYDGEVRFWSELTGFNNRIGVLDVFTLLPSPDHLPVRLLLQRLGPDDRSTIAGAHLDLAAGENNAAVATLHVERGAEIVGTFRHWIVLRDPAGMAYCLTRRHPVTGSLPA